VIRPVLVKWTTGRPKTAPLLVGPRGGRFNHANFRDAVDWVRLVTRLGWPGFRFHDLRATAIVVWIRAGLPLAVFREMAGHASLSTTDRYVRLARNDLSAAASAINAYASTYIAPYMEGEAKRRNGLPTVPDKGERATGIEPALSAWEADVLPLNYARAAVAERGSA
jgi:Phage integrase family